MNQMTEGQIWLGEYERVIYINCVLKWLNVKMEVVIIYTKQKLNDLLNQDWQI